MNHTIQRLTVEISADSQAAARQRQAELSGWCRTDALWGMLSERLNSLVPDDMVLTIPRLEIDVDAMDERSFQKDLIEKLVSRIQELPSFSKSAISYQQEEYVRQMALFFLKNGFYPSNLASEKVMQVRRFLEEQHHQTDLTFWMEFADLTHKSPQILSRLIQHLGLQTVRQILITLFTSHYNAAITEDWINDFWSGKSLRSGIASTDILASEENLWLYFLQNKEHPALQNRAAFSAIFNQIFTGEDGSDAHSNQLSMVEKEELQNEFYVESAGLVLLSPFLPQLFSGLGWTENSIWLDDEKPHLAVRLLNYLAHGAAALESWESDWTLPKILCGLPIETVIFQETMLTQEQLDTADEMLTAVINFWTALKSISPDGLRAMFLRRDGKLTFPTGGSGWRLQVECKAQDILLDRIPWGFGVIRLPWMSEIVFVEWQ